jgi:cell division septation protein DedD
LSHSHEPSYYEIALTNRQVLIVFVVLLICVVAAFFSGVWVGQRDAGTAGAERLAAQAPTGEESAAQGAEIGELHFFADEQASPEPDLATIADDPQPETTLLEDLGGPTEAAEAEVAEREPTEAPPPAQASAGEPAAGSASSSGYVIQVFSSADEAQARKLLGQLTDGGYPAFLSPVEVGSQTMMRVRIGPYTQLANAETVAERIRREFRLDTWVTR